jgi:hypothetical protein
MSTRIVMLACRRSSSKSHASRTNANIKFLPDGLFEVVNVGALSNSDRSGSLFEVNKAPNCLNLLFRHYEWWERVAEVSSTKGEMLCVGSKSKRSVGLELVHRNRRGIIDRQSEFESTKSNT